MKYIFFLLTRNFIILFIKFDPYKQGMGKKTNSKSNALALQVDKKGNIKYDAIVKQGHYEGRLPWRHYY